MAFSKSKLKRFNETMSCAPPPSHYNPKDENSKPRGAFIEKTERFKPLVKAAPSPGHYNPKNDSSKLPGAYIEKTERFKPLVKGQLSMVSTPGTSKNSTGLQDGLIKSGKQKLPSGRKVIKSKSFRSKNMSSCLEGSTGVNKIKLFHDSVSEGTVSTGDEAEDLKIELDSLRSHAVETDEKLKEVKKENEYLLTQVNKLMDMLELEKKKSDRAPVEIVTPSAELQKMTHECEPTSHLKNSEGDVQHSQLKLTELDEEILDLEKYMKWLIQYEETAVHNDNRFLVDLAIVLPAFPDHQAASSYESFQAEYQEVSAVRDDMCEALAMNVLNVKLRKIYGDIVIACSDSYEIIKAISKGIAQYVEDAKIQKEKITDGISSLYYIIENQQEVTLQMNDEVIHGFAALLESLTEFKQLSKAYKEEKNLREHISADNKKILEESQQLSKTIQTLREELDNKILHESELKKVLLSNNVHMSKISSDLELLSLENTVLHEKNANLNDYVKKIETEKEELEQKCNVLSHAADEIKASLSNELSTKMEYELKHTVLSCEVSTLQSCRNQLRDENADLHRCIEQLNIEKQELCSHLNLQQEALKKSHKLIDDVRTERKELMEEFDMQREELFRYFKEVQNGFHKVMQENKLREQSYVEKIAFLESECESMPLKLNKQMKNLEAEKEKWKLLFTNLETKISPFKDQLDAYEHEKNWLLSQNDEKQHELESLSQQYASLLGHQNHKQKIKHIIKIKTANLSLRKEVMALQEKVSRQDTLLRKLKLGQTLVNPKDSKLESALKENKTNISVHSQPLQK